MSSFSGDAGSSGSGWQGCCGRSRTGWKPVEIGIMVAAFAIYWPVGLALLGLKIAQKRGYNFDDAIAAMRQKFGFEGAEPAAQWRPFNGASSGNTAFDDWRAAELNRLEEERRKLDTAHREFKTHMDNLRRAKDREEFDAFMRARGQAQG